MKMNIYFPNSKSKWLILLCLFLSTSFARAQTNLPVVIPPSPNAASLGIYGQIPVSLFSGLPQISIPLGNVTAGDISVPVSLNYHGGGVRLDHHPGWAGLGWDVNAGGIITRKVNGGVDEILTSGFSPETLFGYYYYYYCADYPTWASADTLNYYRDPFSLPHAYPAPDEFMFNVGPYSGSFFYNQKGKWQVRSSDPVNLKVEEQLATNYGLPAQINGIGTLTIKRIFYKFTLTTPDGTKYVFGGTPESIEFTRNSVAQNPNDTYNTQVIATSWYLTSVLSRKGQRIDLTYARDGIQAHQSVNVSRYQYKEGSASSMDYSDTANKTLSVINASYLTSIKAPNQTINFARSQSNELAFNYTTPGAVSPMYRDLSGDPSFSDVLAEIKWVKLDSISFYSDSAGFFKKFAFYYRNNTGMRLTLDSLKEIGAKGSSISPYQFFYDESPLPVYNSRRIDHWGYYNGHNYFTDVPKTPSQYGLADVTPYFTSRNSNTSLVQAGTLLKIKYPTGGTSTFTYEPHDFSKVAKRFPFVVADSTGSAGGLRISKITNQDEHGYISGVKQYLYVRNYNTGGTTSSGILAGVPQYFDQGQWVLPGGTISYWFIYDVSITPLSFTDGNHITYSEVVEKSQDGSYTIYNYSNHDVQTYRDEAPVAGLYSAPLQWKFDPNTSRSLDRGKLLLRSEFNASNVLLHRIKYDYDISAARYAEAVRMINLTFRTFGDAMDSRATAYLAYTFPRYLIRETDSLWDQNGANPLVTLKNITYNTTYRQKSLDSVVNSKGNPETYTYQYPYDLLTAPDFAVYRKMTDSNMIAPVIIQRKLVNNSQVNYTKTNYYEPFAGVYVPQSVDVQVGTNPVETRLQFSNHDSKGNPLTVSKTNDVHTSYIWGYQQLLPTAEVRNADQGDIAYCSFESGDNGNWTITGGSGVATDGFTGTHSYMLVNGASISKTGLNGSRIYVVSYWSRNGALSVNSTSPATGPVRLGWTYYEHRLPAGATSVTITGSNVTFDELRLFPAGAQMTTYTYLPPIGMTAQCDVANRATYYEYDDLNRLLRVRDMDKYILKQYDYVYQVFPTKDSVWQPNGALRCKPCPSNTAYITNMQQHQETDVNPASSTYNTTRWIDDGIPGNCTVLAVWQNTATPVRCQAGYQTTGYQEQEQRDVNPCSPTYNQTKWVVIGVNGTACPYCNTSNCNTKGYKCINGVCTAGTYGILSEGVVNGHCQTVFGWTFPDGTTQIDKISTKC